MTVTSELGEPIHKVATRGVKLWAEFDKWALPLPFIDVFADPLGEPGPSSRSPARSRPRGWRTRSST